MGKIAGFLTGKLLAYSLIEESQEEWYLYGLERLLGKLTSYTAFAIVAVAVGQLIPTVLFLGFLFLLRGRTGGYHASTRFRCFVWSMALYVAVIEWGIPYLVRHPLILWGAYGLAALIIFIGAPVNHPNVAFSEEELQHYRLRARRVLGMEAVVILVMLAVSVPQAYVVSAMMGTIVCSVLVGLAKITGQEV